MFKISCLQDVSCFQSSMRIVRVRRRLITPRVQDKDTMSDYSRMILDIREYDVPYYVRCMIDLDYRVGAWYRVIANKSGKDNKVDVVWQKDLLLKANPRVLAFDIECTKSPLKFPDADVDEIFMISYMVDGKGYLIVSRTVVSKNISDFEYVVSECIRACISISMRE